MYINHVSLYVIVLFLDLHAPAQLGCEDLHEDEEKERKNEKRTSYVHLCS